jgi:5-methylcytosine-specific restriction endonuclease McrA
MKWILFTLVFIYFLIVIISKYNNKEKDSYENSTDIDYNTAYSKRGEYDTRNIALRNAGYKCEKCGSDYGIQVHHKLPVHFGGTNDLSNLEALCYKCHQNLHGYDFDKERSTDTKPVNKKIETIRTAMALKKNIKFKYCNLQGERTYRTIVPLNIYTDNNNSKKGNRVYVEGYCMLRKEERKFRLVRMENIEIV